MTDVLTELMIYVGLQCFSNRFSIVFNGFVQSAGRVDGRFADRSDDLYGAAMLVNGFW